VDAHVPREAFLNDIQQSGPRGADKFFSTNWIMPMAQRQWGNGTLTLRAMLSFEPGTVSKRRYPELFQQGETAFGRAIVDGQHPHDFFMELAALYDYQLSANTLAIFLRCAYGDPAMGPLAYPHRPSAVGGSYRASRTPPSGLHHIRRRCNHFRPDLPQTSDWKPRVSTDRERGRVSLEPGLPAKSDSWSSRLTVNSGQNWSFQYSFCATP